MLEGSFSRSFAFREIGEETRNEESFAPNSAFRSRVWMDDAAEMLHCPFSPTIASPFLVSRYRESQTFDEWRGLSQTVLGSPGFCEGIPGIASLTVDDATAGAKTFEEENHLFEGVEETPVAEEK